MRPSLRAAALAVPAALLLTLPGTAHAEDHPPAPAAARSAVEPWIDALRAYFRHHPSTRPTSLFAVPPAPAATPPPPPRATAART